MIKVIENVGVVTCQFLVGVEIVWCIRKQRNLSLSTAEAEGFAMTGIVKEWLLITSFFIQLSLSEFLSNLCILNYDNQDAISLSKPSVISNRSKHK